MLRRKKMLFALAGTLILLGWGAPGKVFGSCGDYVHPQDNSRQESRSSTQSSHQHAPDSPAAPRNCRCPGPNCSSRNDLPPAPPVSPAPHGEKEAVGWLNLAILFEHQAHHVAQDSGLLPAQGPGLDIFHPPRAL